MVLVHLTFTFHARGIYVFNFGEFSVLQGIDILRTYLFLNLKYSAIYPNQQQPTEPQ